MIKIHHICINLPRAAERKELMIKQFERSEIKDYSFWTGFDGKNIINTSFGAKIIRGYGLGRDLSKGMLCLNIAHITALKLAQYLDLDKVIIFEDDVILCKDWNNRIDILFRQLPEDWEHVYLGGWTDYVKLEVHETPVIFKSPKMVGAFSYMVNKNAYQKMIDYCSDMTTIYDDIVMHMVDSNRLKSYVYMPFMTYPRTEDSDKHDVIIENNERHPSYKYFRDQL